MGTIQLPPFPLYLGPAAAPNPNETGFRGPSHFIICAGYWVAWFPAPIDGRGSQTALLVTLCPEPTAPPPNLQPRAPPPPPRLPLFSQRLGESTTICSPVTKSHALRLEKNIHSAVACRAGVLVSTRWIPGRHLGLGNRESLGWVQHSEEAKSLSRFAAFCSWSRQGSCAVHRRRLLWRRWHLWCGISDVRHGSLKSFALWCAQQRCPAQVPMWLLSFLEQVLQKKIVRADYTLNFSHADSTVRIGHYVYCYVTKYNQV